MILVIVIILVAAIALINVGKVAQYKLQTSNAADSAALAAASTLASTANNIKVQSDELQAQVLATQAVLGVRKWDFALRQNAIFWSAYLIPSVYRLLAFGAMLLASKEAMGSATASAHQYAFSNVGIEEASVRDKTAPQTTPIEQPFSKWLNKQLKDSRLADETYTYSWKEHYFDVASGKQESEAEEAWAKSQAKPGACAMELLPAPPLPLIVQYTFWLPPCDPTGCESCMTVYANNVITIVETALQESLIARTAFLVEFLSIFGGILLDALKGACREDECPEICTSLGLVGRSLHLPLLVIPYINPPLCGHLNTVIFFYIQPFTFLLGISNENKLYLESKVTRHFPQRDLGLWKMGPEDIHSKAKGGIKGCGPWLDLGFGGTCYDAELKEAK
ncbi:MAG: pilus assembly protein TadG-related protein [Candidatus Omnitrophica bacterium]|nr:pilus assembly protein TadG-related protein [Candidatus Omnitrophota bacterium]